MEDRHDELRPPQPQAQPAQPIYHPKPQRQNKINLAPLRTSSSPPRSQSPSPSSNDYYSISRKPSSASTPITAMLDGKASSRGAGSGGGGDSGPHKSHSILNLTSPTLYGIYSPSGYDANREDATPFGSGAQTPSRNTSFVFTTSQLSPARLADISKARRKSSSSGARPKLIGRGSETHHHRHLSKSRKAVDSVWRLVVLFSMGLAYGELVTRLHDTREIAPVQVQGIPRRTWGYLMFWGVVAVALGTTLPLIDGMVDRQEMTTAVSTGGTLEKDKHRHGHGRGGGNTEIKRREEENESNENSDDEEPQSPNSLGAEWNPIVRTVGAFVGIAFAIRRLPWQSTLQVSLTLALVNPVIWYLIDRSRTGFALSLIVGISGAAALIGINPDIVPSPSTTIPKSTVHPTLIIGGVSYESVGVATWISSVLFCSCVCFGNLGRRLGRGGVGSGGDWEFLSSGR